MVFALICHSMQIKLLKGQRKNTAVRLKAIEIMVTCLNIVNEKAIIY